MMFNTTEMKMILASLEPKKKYSVRVSSVLRSKYSNMTFFESAFSKPQMFTLDLSKYIFFNKFTMKFFTGKCKIHSSICSDSNENCEKMVTTPEQYSRSGSLLLIMAAIGCFLILSAFFMIYARKRCQWVKKMLQKADEKGGHETVSLVYGMLL